MTLLNKKGTLIYRQMKVYGINIDDLDHTTDIKQSQIKRNTLDFLLQVSFDEIQDALKNLAQDLQSIRKKVCD